MHFVDERPRDGLVSAVSRSARIVTSITVTAALVCAPTAAADEADGRFLVLLDERGIIIPDDTMLAAVSNGKYVCSALRRGTPVEVVRDEMMELAPDFGVEGANIFVGTAVEVYCIDVTEPAPLPAPAPAPAPNPSQSSYYPNCAAVRAAGAAPLHRGDPGYSSKLDRDGDGIACEK